jgi:hypothetical protein
LVATARTRVAQVIITHKAIRAAVGVDVVDSVARPA